MVFTQLLRLHYGYQLKAVGSGGMKNIGEMTLKKQYQR